MGKRIIIKGYCVYCGRKLEFKNTTYCSWDCAHEFYYLYLAKSKIIDNQCLVHGKIKSTHKYCPKCGAECVRTETPTRGHKKPKYGYMDIDIGEYYKGDKSAFKATVLKLIEHQKGECRG